MAHFKLTACRLIVAAGFASAVAVAPTIVLLSAPGTLVTPKATCPHGEVEDPYTYACVPEMVPNGFSSPSTASGLPSEQQLTECSGPKQSDCIARDYYGTPGAQVPHVNESVQQSP